LHQVSGKSEVFMDMDDYNAKVAEAVLGSLSRPAFQREAERDIAWLREEIAGAKEDVKGLEERAAEIRAQLPKLEIQMLICERDAAEKKLEIIEKRGKLEKLLEGAK
jgi:hypothetical protein